MNIGGHQIDSIGLQKRHRRGPKRSVRRLRKAHEVHLNSKTHVDIFLHPLRIADNSVVSFGVGEERKDFGGMERLKIRGGGLGNGDLRQLDQLVFFPLPIKRERLALRRRKQLVIQKAFAAEENLDGNAFLPNRFPDLFRGFADRCSGGRISTRIKMRRGDHMGKSNIR